MLTVKAELKKLVEDNYNLNIIKQTICTSSEGFKCVNDYGWFTSTGFGSTEFNAMTNALNTDIVKRADILNKACFI